MLAEAALSQVADQDLNRNISKGSNSISILVRHLAGNLTSRYTDFLLPDVDGEKPWRNREQEFDVVDLEREELTRIWKAGFESLNAALLKLSDEDFSRLVIIRGVEMRVDAALHRSLAHFTYHVGQIILLARYFAGESWETLTVLSGQSSSSSHGTEQSELIKW